MQNPRCSSSSRNPLVMFLPGLLVLLTSMMWLNASAQTIAQSNTANPSIMFNNQDQEQSELVTAPDNNNDDPQTRCAKMSRLIDELKGKPQRRNIAIKRYELECKGASFDYDRYYNEGISR